MDGIDIKSILAPSPLISDEEIIQRIIKEGFQAYGSLVKRYNQRMFRVARSVVTDDATAMDIVQDAHIKAYTNLASFQGKGSFAAWIAGITRNQALMHLRKHKREVTMGGEEQNILEKLGSEDENIVPNNQPENALQNQHMQNLINEKLDKLSEKFRSVFILRAIEQFSTKETARILKINEITVKTRFFRSKRFLRSEIQHYLDASDMNVYEFGHSKCDIVLLNVLTKISKI